ncbi:MAG: glycine--tRNA ligase, partial [Dehalococcoidales bacterium]|nr:glycine--tRNA ligase [Dehalococcoidales bacterium]
MTEQTATVTMEKLVSLCQRRGFVFQSSEIYGGLSGCWDYGPLGIELKRNIKQAWWKAMVLDRDDMNGIETSILMHPQVWVASGHLQSFTDPLVECKGCNQRFRADHISGTKCPNCGGALGEPRNFNTMFKTFIGPVEDAASVVYLRPETAQGMFVNFDNVLQATRKKLPFGIAQQGKSFRNEITTGNFIFRSREFEQMEMEYFVKPGTDEQWFEYWLNERQNWYLKHGIKKEHLSVLEHEKAKLAHYAKRVCDITFLYPMGWEEIEGLASRTDFDLKQHSKASGKLLDYYDEETKEHYTPYVIEPAVGVDRCLLAFLCDAYSEEPDKDETRVVLHLHPALAPIKAAILPLSKKENLAAFAHDVHKGIRGGFMTQYDDTQSIGRRYRRQDEIGTPYCVTVDFQSLEDNRVTVRDR